MADRHPRYPATLKELFDELGQKALEGASQADILHWLLGFAKWYGFRLRYDEYQVGEYDPELVEERTREAVALWEARRTQRTAAPAAAKSSAPVLESKTYEEYLAELAAAKKPAAAPAADDSVPESATDDSGTKSATEPPADDSGTEPPADDFVPKAPARQRSGRKRGEAVTVQIRRGRLSVKDPAIRAPRDPPTYTSAIARSDGGRGGSDSRTATSSRNSTRGSRRAPVARPAGDPLEPVHLPARRRRGHRPRPAVPRESGLPRSGAPAADRERVWEPHD